MKRVLRFFLWFAGAYALYFATGMVLTKRNVVEVWWIFPNTIIAAESNSRDNSKAGSDGPHIFYDGKQMVMKTVTGNDSNAEVVTQSIPVAGRDSFLVRCSFGEQPGWDFTTTLKDSLSIEPAEYEMPGKLIAISDIEGEFEAFRKLLVANKVMSEDCEWTYGAGHLVLAGDFFDRGLYVTQCLWLIYKLEQEAEMAGGKVHFILGNHEIMNMGGDLRYLRCKYKQNAKLMNAAYETWFTPGTELGRWLQTKNVAERIGNILFVHGGISEEVNALKLSLTELNAKCRKGYFTDDSVRKHGFDGVMKVLYSGKTSPFWYRGLADEDANDEQVNETLKVYNVSTIVIGHTVVDKITWLYKGKVIDVDVKHAKGKSQALVYENNRFYISDIGGNRHILEYRRD